MQTEEGIVELRAIVSNVKLLREPDINQPFENILKVIEEFKNQQTTLVDSLCKNSNSSKINEGFVESILNRNQACLDSFIQSFQSQNQNRNEKLHVDVAREKYFETTISTLRKEVEDKNRTILDLQALASKNQLVFGSDVELQQAEQMLLKTLSFIEAREATQNRNKFYKDLVLAKKSEAISRLEILDDWEGESDSEEEFYEQIAYDSSPL